MIVFFPKRQFTDSPLRICFSLDAKDLSSGKMWTLTGSIDGMVSLNWYHDFFFIQIQNLKRVNGTADAFRNPRIDSVDSNCDESSTKCGGYRQKKLPMLGLDSRTTAGCIMEVDVVMTQPKYRVIQLWEVRECTADEAMLIRKRRSLSFSRIFVLVVSQL